MTALIDKSILNAADYNDIKLFEDRYQDLDPETLEAIAAIFREHDMHGEFGIGILHRRDGLQDGSIVLHYKYKSGTEVCSIKSLSSVKDVPMRPHSWFLNQDGLFQAFEYEIGVKAAEPSPPFLSDFRKFLQTRLLHDRLTIVRKPAIICDLVRFHRGRGTIAVPFHLIQQEVDESTKIVDIRWWFVVNRDGKVCSSKSWHSSSLRGPKAPDRSQHRMRSRAWFPIRFFGSDAPTSPS